MCTEVAVGSHGVDCGFQTWHHFAALHDIQQINLLNE